MVFPSQVIKEVVQHVIFWYTVTGKYNDTIVKQWKNYTDRYLKIICADNE